MRLEYRSASGALSAQREIRLTGGATLEQFDILSELGIAAVGEGHLRLTSLEGEIVSTALRILDSSPETRVITVLPVLSATSSVSTGTAISLGPFDDASRESKSGAVPSAFSQALGILETGGSSISIEVAVTYGTLKGLSQGVKGRKTYTLTPYQFLLVPDVVREIAGSVRDSVGDIRDVIVTVRGLSGEGRFVPLVVSESVTTGDATITVR